MKTIRKFLIAAVLVALVLLGFAKAPHSVAQDELSGEVTVSVEAWMVEKYNTAELEARFEEAHPDVDVIVITHEGLGANYLNIFLEWAQTDSSTADLYFGGLISQISPAIIDDLLLPWDEVMVGDLVPENWISSFLDYSHVEGPAGTNYPTLPGLGETMNFQFNTSQFAQAGFVDSEGHPVVPTSYEEIYEYACALAELEVNGQNLVGLEMEYGINFAPDTWMAAVIAAEGTYLTEDGLINWDSQAGRDWIEFQKRIVDDGCGGTSTFTDNNGARNGLKAGTISVINASNSRSSEGTNALCSQVNVVPCPDGEVVQMFSYPGDGGVMAFSHQIYIPRVAARPDLARAFAVEAILSEYAQTWAALYFGKMPTIWANYDALPTNPNFDLVRAELEGPSQGQWQYRDGQFLRQAYVDELQLYLIGEQSLDEMIENLQIMTEEEADLTLPADRELD
jgi:multiple sugar transport system substrate-binding protein